MKRILTITLAALTCLSAAAQQKDWNKLANDTADALISNFWGASFPANPTRYYFNYESNEANLENIHYWPQAHAIDVITDALRRTGDARYRVIYPLWWDGLPRFNPNAELQASDRWWNQYVDDMEWICIAQLRMFETVGNPDYMVKAKQTYNNWIISTWGPENEGPWYGGVTWNTSVKKSKNACSNGPAAIIAALIYKNYDLCKVPDVRSKDDYLKDAIMIYEWERKTLFDENTGAVYDNMNLEGKISKHVFSYNQGTFLGAAHLLYQISGDKKYLSDAIKAADYCIANLGAGEPKHLVNPRTGDGGLFHGIFIRYFVQLINDRSLPYEKRAQYHRYLTETAEIAAESLVEGVNLFSPDWLSQKVNAGEKAYLNPHVSGATLMAAMAILDPLD